MTTVQVLAASGCWLVVSRAGTAMAASLRSAMSGIDAFDELLRELDELQRIVTGSGLLLAVMVVVLIWGLASIVSRLLQRAGRSGLGQHRWLSAARVLLHGLVAAWAVLLVTRMMLARAPYVTIMLLVVIAAGILVSVAARVPGFIASALLVLRGGVREGDRLIADDLDGTIERVGVLRLILRRSDGSLVYVPTRHLENRPVTISSPQRACPVEVLTTTPRPLRIEDLEAARRTAALCPYRIVGSEVAVTLLDELGTSISVRLIAWSAEAAQQAELQLRKALVAALDTGTRAQKDTTAAAANRGPAARSQRADGTGGVGV